MEKVVDRERSGSGYSQKFGERQVSAKSGLSSNRQWRSTQTAS